MAIELVGDQRDLYDRLSELTHAHPPGTVFRLDEDRACYRTSNGDVFWQRGEQGGCGTLAEAVRALTVQTLGPAAPDALTCGPLRLERLSPAMFAWHSGNGTYDDSDPETTSYAQVWDGPRDWSCRIWLQSEGDERLESRDHDSPTEAAQALAAAVEASTDPAVVRFREEHWHVAGRRDRSAHQPTPQQIAARLDVLELAKSTPPFPPELLAEWRNGTGRPNARALQELRDYAAELRDAAGELVEACDAVDR